MKPHPSRIVVAALLASTALLSACSVKTGGEDSTAGGGGTAKSVAFNISNSQVVVATSQLSSLAAGASLTGNAKVMTFYDSTSAGTAKGVALSRAVAGQPLTNFFSIDPNGVIQQAVISDVNVKVLYSVGSPDGLYLYVALDASDFDTREVIGSSNCAIFKVTVADSTHTCLDTGYVTQGSSDWTRNYTRTIGGNVKPIQIDPTGNVFFLGWPFTAGNGGGLQYDQKAQPVIRRINTDGTSATITPDVLSIDSFLVTKWGAVVYAYNDWMTYRAGLKVYDLATGSTNELTPSDASSWFSNQLFYMTDDKETLIFGSPRVGVLFAQKPKSGFIGGKYVNKLDISLFKTGNWGSDIVRVVAGDDGNLYGLFSDQKWNYNNQTGISTCDCTFKLYQLLPHNPVVIATIKSMSNNSEWWSATNGIDLVIDKGYVYFVEKETHPLDGFSPRTIIKAVNLTNKKTYDIKRISLPGQITPENWDDWTSYRHDIYSWKLVNGKLTFSGFNNANSQMVLGELDVAAFKTATNAATPALVAEGIHNAINYQKITSVAGASAQIQDMEAVQAVAANVNDGSPLTATVFTDSENLYSVSVKFSKAMNKDSANGSTAVTDGGSPSNSMNVWLGKSLHMIMDLDAQNSSNTVPLSYNTTYDVTLQSVIYDAWGTGISGVSDSLGNSINCGAYWPATACPVSLITRPQYGWWRGQDIVPPAAGITDGVIGKLALPNPVANSTNNWVYNKMALLDKISTISTADTAFNTAVNTLHTADPNTKNLKFEISLKNRGSGNLYLNLESTQSCTGTGWYAGCSGNTWASSPLSITLYSGSMYMNYWKYDPMYSWSYSWGYVNTYDTLGSNLPFLNGQWSKLTVEIYGDGAVDTIKVTATPADGSSPITLANVTDAGLAYGTYYNYNDGVNSATYTDNWRLTMQFNGNRGDVYYFDNVSLTELDNAGAVMGPVFSENFTDLTKTNWALQLRAICDQGSTTNCAAY